MDALFPELTRRLDPSKPVGYLNFSDGRADARFRKTLLDAFAILAEHDDPAPWVTVGRWLAAAANDLQKTGSAAFKDVSQAREVIELSFIALPLAYRIHHADLLAHQPDAALFTPLFMARSCEVIMAARAAGVPAEKLAARGVTTLNDFVGYRPIAVLETRPQTDFYPHERVCPVPLYFRGVGVSPGPYSNLLTATIDLLTKTESSLLDEACLDLERLDEVALDPRAIDHFHPVTKRPNVLFGEWDPHKIDNRGYYRRFVLKQTTLDALLRWATPNGTTHPERLFEAAAVLAGTTLMGTGICGSGPTHHDSTVTLATLVQRIARFRDNFYQTLLQALPGNHGERLRKESEKLKQPFGGVRQFLNQAIASERALHLQERRLAVLFAAMGYPNAARTRAAAIPAPATRLGAEIRLRQTAAIFAVRAGRVSEVPELLAQAEDHLRRGIECGALIDPWNILGYQGLFPTFADRGDTVRDPRAEELILTLGRQFDAYSQGLAAAAAAEDGEATDALRRQMAQLADWWDRFATSTVADLPKVVGGERADAADHVASALALWKLDGAYDPDFWRKHRAAFTAPVAYAQVIDALIEQGDHRAALALLVTWLSEADLVPLQDPSASFFRLTFRWLRGVVTAEDAPTERASVIRRFFELLEVNADNRWQVPGLPSGGGSMLSLRDLDDDDDFEDILDDDDLDDEGDSDLEDDEDDDDDTFSSAYEGMTFRDSADDGQEGSLADGNDSMLAAGGFALDGEDVALGDRLRFLTAVARFWRLGARPELWPKTDSSATTTVSEWLRLARSNFAELVRLIHDLHGVTIPEPVGGVEAVTEFDRRRGVKGSLLEAAVMTAVETAAAARSLAAVLPKPVELPGGGFGNLGPTAEVPAWEGVAIRLERAVATGDRGGARRLLPSFIGIFRHEPLLVSPPADGGPPGPAIRAQAAQQMMESLLGRLPRLGLLRETFHLTRLARAMERNDMPEGRRVSSFDVLFRTAVVGTVDAILAAARDWGDDAGEDGPLAGDLKQVAESYHKLWVEHSQTLRLSALEAVLDRSEWDETRQFIRDYGSDLFIVRFLTLSNIRGILAQGVPEWLDREANQGDEEGRPKLIADWSTGDLDKSKTTRLFEVVLNALVEHYDEYRDYNTTTTQSDYGENIYILLDFLRLKVAYDRYAWRLRPLVLAHEVLCRRGYDRLAAKWREFVTLRTHKLAEESLVELARRESEHGIKLRTVRDRLEERFVQPLQVDQAAARVSRASNAAREGQPEDNPSFVGLLAAVKPLADSPVGVGLDVPAWVRRLEDELRKVRLSDPDLDDEDAPITRIGEDYPLPPSPKLDHDDFRAQIRDWDDPPA